MNRLIELQESLTPKRKKLAVTKSIYGKSLNIPRGIRNNNPGNIDYNANNDWVGKVPKEKNTDSRFEQFTDYKYGVRALIMLLRTYIKQKNLDTVTKVFGAYAPPSENSTQSYIKFVANRLGIKPDDTITFNKATIRELAQAIAKMENGQEAITNDQFEEGFKELPEKIRNELDPPPAPPTAKSLSSYYDEPAYQYGGRGFEFFGDSFSVSVKAITINVVEDSAKDNGYLTAKAKMLPDALRVKSVDDMVTKILALLGTDGKIDKLYIYGHGTDGYISVGAGQIMEANKRINGNEEWKPFLEKLKNRFIPGAEVFLGGCHTGAGAEGAKKLKKLADLWGVTVSASTGFVWADHEEPGAVHQVASFDKPQPAPIDPPSSDTKKKEMTKAKSFSLAAPNNNISRIYIHPIDQPLDNASQARFKFTNPNDVKRILSGIDLSKTTNVKGMNGIINGRIFFVSDQGPEEYIVFAAYNFILKKGEWEKAYTVKYELMNELKQLLSGDNRFTNV